MLVRTGWGIDDLLLRRVAYVTEDDTAFFVYLGFFVVVDAEARE